MSKSLMRNLLTFSLWYLQDPHKWPTHGELSHKILARMFLVRNLLVRIFLMKMVSKFLMSSLHILTFNFLLRICWHCWVEHLGYLLATPSSILQSKWLILVFIGFIEWLVNIEEHIGSLSTESYIIQLFIVFMYLFSRDTWCNKFCFQYNFWNSLKGRGWE